MSRCFSVLSAKRKETKLITWPWSKIERIPQNGADRPVLGDVYFEAGEDGEGLLVAADGFILAAIPVEQESEDVTGHIPLEAIKRGRKHYKSSRLHLSAGQQIEFPYEDDGPRFMRYQGTFPDWHQIVPNYERDDCPRSQATNT